MVGDTLGRYRILAKLGAGGMGEVYRARDEQLRRDVAIKVLPSAVEHDNERLRRLTNEARAASALNHPHIVAIYEIGDVHGAPFIAMELVAGVTLRERLRGGALPLLDALDIAMQVAAALSAAHDAGVIHRDVKPDNVMVRGDGYIKVLDFGLAALRPDPSAAAALSKLETVGPSTGGTPCYMAPEQIDGAADTRGDIFAFGVLLCELTTGVNPFRRLTVLDTLNAIGQTPAPAAPVTTALPGDVRRIILRCLERDPQRRYSAMADVVADLRRTGHAAPAASSSFLSGSRAIAAGALLLALAALAAVVWLWVRGGEGAAPPIQLTHFSTAVRDPALSPDGRLLVYVVQEADSPNSQLFVQSFPDGQPRQLTRTAELKSWPAFSPDGSRVAYTVTGAEWKWDTWVVPLVRGAPQMLLRNAAALQWLSDGRVLFSEFKRGSQLGIVVSAESRRGARDVYVPDGIGMAHFSDVSPDGRRIAIGQMGDPGGAGTNSAVPLSCIVAPFERDAPVARAAIGDADVSCSMFVRWSHDGRSLFFSSGRGSRFDVFRQRAEGGRPQQVTAGGIAVLGVLSSFVLTSDGQSLVYPRGETQEAIWVRREDGTASQLTLEGNALNPVPFADGTRLLYIFGPRFAPGQIWMRTVDGTRAERLFAGFEAQLASPSSDGSRVAFTTIDAQSRSHLWAGMVDNSIAPRELILAGAEPILPVVSPDCATVFCTARTPEGDVRIWRVAMDGSDARPITDAEPGLQLRSIRRIVA